MFGKRSPNGSASRATAPLRLPDTHSVHIPPVLRVIFIRDPPPSPSPHPTAPFPTALPTLGALLLGRPGAFPPSSNYFPSTIGRRRQPGGPVPTQPCVAALITSGTSFLQLSSMLLSAL